MNTKPDAPKETIEEIRRRIGKKLGPKHRRLIRKMQAGGDMPAHEVFDEIGIDDKKPKKD